MSEKKTSGGLLTILLSGIIQELLILMTGSQGGELVFPRLGMIIVPKPGLFVAFPSNHNFVHAVPKVLSGKRYSLPVWFTLNSTKAMQV
jgi:2OG-Fe(II) oxygenase superfamily